jgi:hypothetical protein
MSTSIEINSEKKEAVVKINNIWQSTYAVPFIVIWIYIFLSMLFHILSSDIISTIIAVAIGLFVTSLIMVTIFWDIFGKEIFTFKNESLYYRREIFTRGFTKEIQYSQIKQIEYLGGTFPINTWKSRCKIKIDTGNITQYCGFTLSTESGKQLEAFLKKQISIHQSAG